MAASGLIAGCGSSSDETADTESTGTESTESADGAGSFDPAVFDGEATTVDGASYDLGALADADLVIWFWAPW